MPKGCCSVSNGPGLNPKIERDHAKEKDRERDDDHQEP